MSADIKALIAKLKQTVAEAEKQLAAGGPPTASASGKKDLNKLKRPAPSAAAPVGESETDDADGQDRPAPVSDGGQDADPSSSAKTLTAPSTEQAEADKTPGDSSDDETMDEEIEQDTMPENDPAGNEEIAPDDQAGDEAPPLDQVDGAATEEDQATAADQDQPGDPESGENDDADAQRGGMCYLAGDGDSIGAHVGQAVLSDDVEALASVSQAINAGQNLVMDWCEQNGGRVISAGGDEFVLEMPSCDPGALEELRSQYAATVGATLTVGVGSSMSEAGKALIAGKLNGKDQVCQFDPSIDQQLQAAHAGAAAAGGEAQKQDDHYLSSMYQDDGDGGKEVGANPAQASPDDPQAKLEAVAPPEEGAGLDSAQALAAPAPGQPPAAASGQQPPAAKPPMAAKPAAAAPAQAAPGQDDDQDPGMADVMNDQVDRGNGENIKSKLAEILQAFRQDQSFVEGSQQSDPNLYKECMTLLQQMIKVAKLVQPGAQQAGDAPGGLPAALADEDPAQAAKQPADGGKKPPFDKKPAPQGHEDKADEKAADKEGDDKSGGDKPFPPKEGGEKKDAKPDDKKGDSEKEGKKPFPPKK